MNSWKGNAILRFKGEDGQLKEIKNAPIDIRLDAVKSIPPGAVFVVQGTSWISRLIGLWWLIKNFSYCLKKGFKLWCSHVGNYYGGGHKTVEAFANGIREGCFDKYLGDKTKVKVWANKNLTVAGLQKGKEFEYGLVNKKEHYDWAAFINFVIPLGVEDKGAYICSGLATAKVEAQGLPMWKYTSYDKVHPTDVERYLDSKEAAAAGWEVVYSWNW